jgi:hypothetical protein
MLSALSVASLPPGSTPVSATCDAFGLSALEEPGIFERMEPRSERVDSLVSALLKDGYDSSPSAGAWPDWTLSERDGLPVLFEFC